MTWLDNVSIGTMTVLLLAAFFATGWIVLKLCDLAPPMNRIPGDRC